MYASNLAISDPLLSGGLKKPKTDAYISAKTHICNFLASQMVVTANINSKKTPRVP